MESNQSREPWNKNKLIGQKPPLKPKDIWAISRSIASCAAAISSIFEFAILPTGTRFWLER